MKIFTKNKKGFTLIELERSKSVRRNEGFTLIELLVVIAIIGLLSSIVLVSLSGARNKAKDARIITDMVQMRSSAEIFYGINNTYTGFASSTDATTLIGDIQSQGGTSFVTNIQTGSGAGNSYCMKVILNSTRYWCVDSSFRSQQYPSTFAGCTACAGVTCRCE